MIFLCIYNLIFLIIVVNYKCEVWHVVGRIGFWVSFYHEKQEALLKNDNNHFYKKIFELLKVFMPENL